MRSGGSAGLVPESADGGRSSTRLQASAGVFSFLGYRLTFTPSKERKKRRERTVSFGGCVALEGESDGSPGESSLGFHGSHRGK